MFISALLLLIFSSGFEIVASDSSVYEKTKSGKEEEENVFIKDSDAVRILAYNVHHCRGMDGEINYERTARIISDLDADFVCLQELDSVTERSGGVNQVEILAKMTDMHASFGAAINFQGGAYGVGILSREEALQTANYPLPGNEARTFLVAEFSNFVVISTHLDLDEKYRLESIKIITEKARFIDKEIFMAGDFNESDFSGVVFSELKKDWKLVSVTDHTFPTGSPEISIDFVFSFKREAEAVYEPSNSSVVYSIPGVDVSVASDHYPVFCDFYR